MICHRGAAADLPLVDPCPELGGAPCPVRHHQGRRDPRPTPRTRRPTPHNPDTQPDLGGPRATQRTGSTPPPPAPATLDRHAPNPAALARPPRQTTLDQPTTPTR